MEPENAGAYLNLGLLLRTAGRQGEGDTQLTKAIQLDPTVASRIDPPIGTPASTSTTTAPAGTKAKK